MATWNSSPHPISDIRDWKQLNRLELRPDFQRRSVWSPPAKIMLIDTILKNIPMPKIFLSAELRTGCTYRIVIDGQQRISAILDFLEDKFSLDSPYIGPYAGLKYSGLPHKVQEDILQYKLDFSEIGNADDQELREIFHRVNKYTVALNSQELRNADFPGHFQETAKKLSNHPFFDEYNIFTSAHRRRSLDIEYVSELLIIVVSGISNKKEAVDAYYKDYMVWDESKKKKAIEQFKQTLAELETLAANGFNIKNSRFKQKADFYSLFAVILEIVKAEKSLTGQSLSLLIQDLDFLSENIAPESSISDLKNYAVKCVSQANTASSREWRKKFLRIFFNGTMKWYPPEQSEISLLSRIIIENDARFSDMRPSCLHCCSCDGKIAFWDKNFKTLWQNTSAHQLSNAHFCHIDCTTPSDFTEYAISLKSSQFDELAQNADQIRLGFNDV